MQYAGIKVAFCAHRMATEASLAGCERVLLTLRRPMAHWSSAEGSDALRVCDARAFPGVPAVAWSGRGGAA